MANLGCGLSSASVNYKMLWEIQSSQNTVSSPNIMSSVLWFVVCVSAVAFGLPAGDFDSQEEKIDDGKQNLPQSNVQVHYNETSGHITTITFDIDFVNNTTETTIVTEEAPFCGCYCGIQNRKHRIVGGNETKIHEFPWMVAMYRRNKFYCAGALVTRRHVVTAAHCVYGFNSKEIKVVLGDHDRDSIKEAQTIEMRLKSATPHPGFDLYSFNNDVAVLELESPVVLSNNIQTACLPSRPGMNYTGKTAIIAGWGRQGETRPTSGRLRSTVVPVMSDEACAAAGYKENRVTENMMCAGYPEGGMDACQGDSGGPMLIEATRGYLEIAGIVSWGRGCARPNYPGVYTRVGNFLEWIQEHVTNDCYCDRP